MVPRRERQARAALETFVGTSPVAGHNISVFDLPLLARAPMAWSCEDRQVLDTLALSELADPLPGHRTAASPLGADHLRPLR